MHNYTADVTHLKGRLHSIPKNNGPAQFQLF